MAVPPATDGKHTQYYCFATVGIQFYSATGGIRDAVQEVLGYFGICPEKHSRVGEWDKDQVRLDLDFEESAVPVEAIREGAVGSFFSVWRDACNIYLEDGASQFQLDLSARRGWGHIHPSIVEDEGEGRKQFFRLLGMSLSFLLRENGLFPMHAAALQQGGEGVLIVADSDCGKSTMTYSLVRQGWDYLSDDAILIRDQGANVEAIPFRRMFGLDAEAGQFFPELNRDWTQPFREEGKWAVAVDTLFPSQAAERCVPRVLVFPEIVDRDMSEIVEISRVEALHELIWQSDLSAVTPETSQRQMDVLKTLVDQTRHFRIYSGRDLVEIPHRTAEILAPLLHGAKHAA